MPAEVSTTAKIRLTIEIDWHASFGQDAKAIDIYTTAARECQRSLEQALREGKVRFRIIGEVEPLMIILPVKDPKK